MKNYLLCCRVMALAAICLFIISAGNLSAQDSQARQEFKPFLSGGVNLLLHNGIWGATIPARPVGGEYMTTGGDPYTGYGMGVNIDYRLMKYLGVHFDINTYSVKTPVGYEGGYATSGWVWEMNDYGSDQVGPFQTDANYMVETTGMRLGLKAYYPLKEGRIEPWLGIYYGYWTYRIGIYSDDRKLTYGNTSGDVPELMMYNLGVDFWDKDKSYGFTIFVEGGSPVTRAYSIENCLVNGWVFEDYGEGSHLFGYYRFGVSLNFITRKKVG